MVDIEGVVLLTKEPVTKFRITIYLIARHSELFFSYFLFLGDLDHPEECGAASTQAARGEHRGARAAAAA